MTAKATFSVRNVIFDGERCIKCTRCVRFCQEITKTDELAVVNRGDHSTIALFADAVLDNPLSANVVDICPVGALTDRDFRFKVRVWYLEKTPSICPGCSTGCNISVETYQNRIARFKPRVNEAVNSHWICDEGRYCFHDLTGGERLTTPMIRHEGGLVPTTWEQALQAVLTDCDRLESLGGILSGAKHQRRGLFVRQAHEEVVRQCRAGSRLPRARADRDAENSHEPGPLAELPRRPRYGRRFKWRFRRAHAPSWSPATCQLLMSWAKILSLPTVTPALPVRRCKNFLSWWSKISA